MKYFMFLFSFIALISIADCNGQGFSIPESSASSSSVTKAMTIDGLAVKGGVTDSGNVWVLRVSAKSGKEYKQYLGVDTKKTIVFEGRPRPVYSKTTREGVVTYYMVYAKAGATTLSTKKVVQD